MPVNDRETFSLDTLSSDKQKAAYIKLASTADILNTINFQQAKLHNKPFYQAVIEGGGDSSVDEESDYDEYDIYNQANVDADSDYSDYSEDDGSDLDFDDYGQGSTQRKQSGFKQEITSIIASAARRASAKLSGRSRQTVIRL